MIRFVAIKALSRHVDSSLYRLLFRKSMQLMWLRCSQQLLSTTYLPLPCAAHRSPFRQSHPQVLWCQARTVWWCTSDAPQCLTGAVIRGERHNKNSWFITVSRGFVSTYEQGLKRVYVWRDLFCSKTFCYSCPLVPLCHQQASSKSTTIHLLANKVETWHFLNVLVLYTWETFKWGPLFQLICWFIVAFGQVLITP